MANQTNTYPAGIATAYGAAVRGGYTGTYAEFCAQQAQYAENAQAVEQAKTDAQAAATAATTKAGEAGQSATAAAGSATAAAGSATAAAGSATAAAGSATTAGSKATEAAASATAAGQAKTAAETAQSAAETAKTGAETAAESVEASAAQIAQNAADITLVKSHFEAFPDDGTAANAKQLLTDKGITESVPYHFRRSGGDGADREFDTVVGGTVVWNQLANPIYPPTDRGGFTFTYDDISFTVNGTNTTSTPASGWFYLHNNRPAYMECSGHKVLFSFLLIGGTLNNNGNVRLDFGGNNVIQTGETKIISPTLSSASQSVITFLANTSCTNARFSIRVCDLTKMFGTTIADYLYVLESGTAGAGVAKLKEWGFFTEDYYPYDAGTLKSVEGVSAHKTVGFNQWDEEWEVGTISVSTGENATDPSRIRSKNYVPCVPQTQYYVIDPTNGNNIKLIFYSASKEFLYASGWTGNTTFTTRSDVYYIRLITSTSYGTTYKHNICINFSDPSRNGTYEPYNGHSYALDDSLTLRGIPKLNSNNQLYYDGDTYASDGTVTRRYYEIDLSTLNWVSKSTGTVNRAWAADLPFNYAGVSAISNWKCSSYPIVGATSTASIQNVGADNKDVGLYKYNYYNTVDYTIYLIIPKEATISGTLVYCLETPTTETAEPFQSPQICSPYGTEEYITTGIVPVGHSTFYPENLRAKVEQLPWNFSTLIAPTESTFTASRNYTTGALFIVNNVLYKATANIANNGTIMPGTNCTATTLAEIISALA